MDAKSLIRTIVIFVALMLTGVSLIVFGLEVSSSQARAVLPLVGAAMFSAALTYFLLEVSRLYAQISR